MNEDLDKLFDPTGTKQDGMPLNQLAARPHRADVIVGDVVEDPLVVDVAVVADRVVGAVQHLGDGAVAQQAGGQGELQTQPVARHAHVEHVARVRRAGHVLLGRLDLRLGDPEARAVVQVQGHLRVDVVYDLGAL